MFRCRKPGCPSRCGTRIRPSCNERLLCYVLLILLAGAFVWSLGMGLKWAKEAGWGSGTASEAEPVARAEMPKLVRQAVDHGVERSLGDGHGNPAFLADAAVQVAQQG